MGGREPAPLNHAALSGAGVNGLVFSLAEPLGQELGCPEAGVVLRKVLRGVSGCALAGGGARAPGCALVNGSPPARLECFVQRQHRGCAEAHGFGNLGGGEPRLTQEHSLVARVGVCVWHAEIVQKNYFFVKRLFVV